MINDHRQWLYHREEGGRIFEVGEEIPQGWYDSPAFDDPRTRPMWDVHKLPETKTVSNGSPPVGATDKNPEGTDSEPATDSPSGSDILAKKHPSQLNKSEAIIVGGELGIEFQDGTTRKEMVAIIRDELDKNE